MNSLLNLRRCFHLLPMHRVRKRQWRLLQMWCRLRPQHNGWVLRRYFLIFVSDFKRSCSLPIELCELLDGNCDTCRLFRVLLIACSFCAARDLSFETEFVFARNPIGMLQFPRASPLVLRAHTVTQLPLFAEVRFWHR